MDLLLVQILCAVLAIFLVFCRCEWLTFCVLVTKGTFSHIRQFDGALRACIHKPVAALRVELSSCDDLGQFLHISWLDIDNVEALVLDVQVPQIYP